MFTARYGLSAYIKQTVLVFKGLIVIIFGLMVFVSVIICGDVSGWMKGGDNLVEGRVLMC